MAKKKELKYEEYDALVKQAVDGDTIVCMVSMGLSVYMDAHVRLYGINAEELKSKSKKALDAKQYLSDTLTNKQVVLRVYGREKYGRLLADVVLGAEVVNQTMVDKKLAIVY